MVCANIAPISSASVNNSYTVESSCYSTICCEVYLSHPLTLLLHSPSSVEQLLSCFHQQLTLVKPDEAMAIDTIYQAYAALLISALIPIAAGAHASLKVCTAPSSLVGNQNQQLTQLVPLNVRCLKQLDKLFDCPTRHNLLLHWTKGKMTRKWIVSSCRMLICSRYWGLVFCPDCFLPSSIWIKI